MNKKNNFDDQTASLIKVRDRVAIYPITVWGWGVVFLRCRDFLLQFIASAETRLPVVLRTMWAPTISFHSSANPTAIRFLRSSPTNRSEFKSLKLRASFFDYPLASRIIVRSKNSFLFLTLLLCIAFCSWCSCVNFIHSIWVLCVVFSYYIFLARYFWFCLNITLHTYILRSLDFDVLLIISLLFHRYLMYPCFKIWSIICPQLWKLDYWLMHFTIPFCGFGLNWTCKRNEVAWWLNPFVPLILLFYVEGFANKKLWIRKHGWR